ncbi:Ion channel [Oesophagostomum dentatum]|uniref:Ion channel n=1 Tax=Oesophagostomum dentatum TaxID=61180 RepID=A0A0B1SUR2_OESDE|nr:Ion channel [Oesophagostomum dentatum]
MRQFEISLARYRRRYCKGSFTSCDFDDLVALIRDGASGGLTSPRERFDYLGSLFFSATVISTIGFGSSTPRTTCGRVLTIVYGVVGCTSCVLFFNLFLERFVTALSYFLRYFHEKKIQRRMMRNSGTSKPVTLLINNEDYCESASSCDGPADGWRPSVYKVFFCLFSISALLISSAALIYSHVEDWAYEEALYFCFISFATIGFGDYVSNQKDVTKMNRDVYRFLNFAMLTLGACCFYCLFNVSSIVVRQLLNFMIKKMDVKGTICCLKKKRRYMGLGLRPPKGYDEASERSSVDYQDGLLSLKEFLMNNQSSVLLLQKQLIKSAMKNAKENEEQKISATRVGPMGILDQAFGDEN